jgi:catechol 2,3-dioxygenase-like lactoylglutathione lyase family enzyme
MIKVQSLNHAGLTVKNFEKSIHFYENILGLKRLPRPPFGPIQGAWYGCGENQVHVNQWDDISSTMNGPNGHNPMEKHLAVIVDDIEEVRKRLDAEGLVYDYFDQKFGDVEIKAIYTRDYDGNTFEIRTSYPMPQE